MDVTGRTKLYRKDFNGKPSYSRSISSREYKDGQKGDWVTVYESVQMPKGTDLDDRTIIEVTHGFESTYKAKDGNRRKLVVLEYNVLDAADRRTIENVDPDGFTALADEEVPF